MRIIIPDFPFPPSSNAIRGSFFDKNKGKMRHYDKTIYKKYKASCEAWAWTEFQGLRDIRPLLKKLVQDQKTLISVSSYFVFKHSDIWSATGSLKEMDTSNRIKACHDELAKYLEIDDRYFNIKNAEKVWVYDHEPERVMLILEPQKIRSLAEIESSVLKSVNA